MRRSRVSSWLLLSALAVSCGQPRDDARDSAATSASTSLAGSPSVTRADSLLRLGDSVYRRSPDSARQLWTVALAEARAANDSANIARALTGLGQAARLLGDFAASRRLGEQALTLKLRLGMTTELFKSYNALGLLAWGEERLGDASALLTKAGDAARAMGDSVALTKAVMNSGLVAQDLGQFERARAAFESARDAARALGDSATLGRTLDNLGSLEIKMGNPIAAIAAIEPARQIARLIGDSVVEVNARGQLATAYDALGEPQRAFALLDSALTMAQRGKRLHEDAEDLKLIGDLFLDAGDYQRSLDYYRRALVVTESLGQPEERGNILRNEARAHAALGNMALAAQRANEALRIHKSAGVAYPQIADLIVLAGLAQRDRRIADAESFVRSAQVIASTMNAPVAAVQVAIAEAALAADAGQWTRVLRVLERARGGLDVVRSATEAEALTLRARAHAQLGQLDAGVAAGRRAIAAAERVRGNYASGELRTTYVAGKAGVYTQQVLLLLRAGRTDEAFEVADAARGRALLEHLTAARADVRASRAAPLLEQEQLLRRIDGLVARLQQRDGVPPRERSPSFSTATAELRDTLLAVRAEYEALLARGATVASPASMLDARGRPSAVEIRKSLEPGEVLLEYFVTPERLLIFAMTAHGLSTHTVEESATNLSSRVNLARELMRRREQSTAAHSVLRALHAILLAPVAASGTLRDATRLIVVPHGALTYLPFAALIDPASGRYVAETHSLLRVSTSASLPALRSHAATNSARLTAEVFAPFPDSLPATRDEAVSVAATLARSPQGVRVASHVGAGATEARMRESLTRGGIVHVATHARLNKRNPLFSHIELSRGRSPGSPPADNGRLEVHELLGQQIDAPLVFLSGCETALGGAWGTRFDTGEDYTTLGQAFLYMGARNVVATLWRIDDVGAAAFAKAFYSALNTGAPGAPGVGGGGVPEALARAQRQVIADSRFSSPYYWAAYEATGGGMALTSTRANVARLSDKQ